MSISKGVLIAAVEQGSPAEKAGIKPGWRLLNIDNRPVGDVLDYRIAEADGNLSLLTLTEKGRLKRFAIRKEVVDSLGLRFQSPAITAVQRCGNRCLFCFIDQNPPGMRAPLYLKDDDYRLSFLYGNFITLNRLTEAELNRIIKMQLSPLYVSVHSTNPSLRRKLFRTDKSDQGLKNLERLVKAGISIHAQVVLCPDLNSGPELRKTVADLHNMKSVTDVALVPVGLTSYRKGSYPLRRFSRQEAADLIGQVSKWQEVFLKSRKNRFVFLADELYLMAGLKIPEDNHYEGYPQLENGIGLARLFLEELKALAGNKKPACTVNSSATLVTGCSSEPLIRALEKEIGACVPQLSLNTVVAENNFFGKEVTVSGLLTGSDLIKALRNKKLGDIVYIPAIMLKDDTVLFLDDLSLQDVEKAISRPVIPVSGPLQLLEHIYSEAAVAAKKIEEIHEND